jgi:DNA helicase-2/ATP-dependent DNA helicase PcrA
MPLSNLNLNENQKLSATADFGHNLIIASAGTGKTSTIVGRIAYLISKGIEPEEILLLTFTNKAAQEMVERVAKIFSQNVANRIMAGTFHSTSYKFLRKADPHLILKPESDIRTLFRSIYDRRDFRLTRESSVKQYESKYLYETYLFYQNIELNLDFGDWIEENREDQRIYADIYQDIVNEFEAEKRDLGFMNFNDLLLRFREFLSKSSVGFKEVLIDEYQDTNLLQDSLIEKMNPLSLFCVGDYDQSIYAFNGANIEIIGNFSKKFSDAKVFTLTKNYRSTSPILELANLVIEKNERLYEKRLEVTKLSPNIEPKVLKFGELYEQYRGISKKISESKTRKEKIAVLFRNNSSADGIEATLKELGIPSKRRGGRGFFETREIKSILDIYTLLINNRDMMAFIHVFEYGKGLGTAVSKELFNGLKRLGNGSIYNGLYSPDRSVSNPFEQNRANSQLLLSNYFEELGTVSRFKHLNFPESFLSNPILKHPRLSEDGAKMLFDFRKLLLDIKRVGNPHSAIKLIRENMLYRYIANSLVKTRSRLKNGEFSKEKEREEIAKISEKLNLLQKISGNYKDHRSFLNAMVLGSKDLTKGEGVNLLTVHASKGLEFQEVYIVDLMDGRFPNTKLASQNGGVEEERRLFYVAVTRAEEILYLSYAMRDDNKKDRKGNSQNFKPSQFIYEGGLLDQF